MCYGERGFVSGTISGFGAGVKFANDNNVNLFTGRPNPVMERPVTPDPLPTKAVGVEVDNSKFRTEPQNLPEQLTLAEAKSGQGYQIMEGKINDPKWQGYEKWQHVHFNQSTQKNITIHYWYNPETGSRVSFKFK